MSEDIPVEFPAGYASGTAVGFTAESGNIVLVGSDTPLPVALSSSAAPAVLTGLASDSGLVGPYSPVPGQPVVLQLSGAWTGTVTLQRSTDGGATRVPLTAGGLQWGVFTANACEPVWIEHEAAATLYLDIAISQGALAYRVSQ
jgi:hypothetical protein